MVRTLCLLTTFALCTSFFSPATNAQVLINEFLAKNVTTNPDMCDYDDFSDWIELYNSGSSAVDLSGYYLTGNLTKPTKWAIPSGTSIPANGYLLFWADGYNDKPGTKANRPYYPFNESFTTQRYHTNFKLAKDGEQVGLFKGSTLVDSVTFPVQLGDVSMGRNPDDNNKWYKYDQPTPGAANTTTAKPPALTTYSPAVTFSEKGGFYPSAQTITLSAPSGSTIYYTLNGSYPTVKSAKYTAPISVSSTKMLRARSIDNDKIAGPVTTNTYFINEKARTIAVVSLVADSSFMWDKTIGMYTNSYKQKEIPASMEFITPDGKQAFQVNVAIGPGSLTSYEAPQKPLQISLESKYGNELLDYPLFAKPFTTFKRLRLRNSDDAWATNLMADNIIEALIDKQMDCATQAYRPVVVFLNGAYWGIMDLREQFDELFFMHNWNVDTTGLTMVKRSMVPSGSEGFELQRGTWTDWNSMKSTVASGNATNIQKVIDAASIFDGICMAHYSESITWGHNVDFWKVVGSPWRRNLADLDRGFDYTKVNINLFSNGGGSISGPLMTNDTVFAGLVKIADFKNLFVQRYAAHLNSTFKPSRFVAIIDSISKVLSPEMADHATRWKNDKGIQSLSAWQGEVDKMKKFGTERAAVALAQIASQFSLAGTAKLTVDLSVPGAGDIYVAGVKMCSGTSALDFFKSVPLTVKAVAKPGYAFVKWEGGATTDSTTITLTGNTSLTAVFAASGTTHISSLAALNSNQFRIAGKHCSAGGSQVLDMEYSVSGKTFVSFELFSLSGKRLGEVFTTTSNAGLHHTTLSTGHRVTGASFLKMKTNFGVQVVKVLLN